MPAVMAIWWPKLRDSAIAVMPGSSAAAAARSSNVRSEITNAHQLEVLANLVRPPRDIHHGPGFVSSELVTLNDKERFHELCRANGIIYQGFSLLTANANELRHPAFRRLVTRLAKTPAQVVFRFAQQIGILPLTGTTNRDHMRGRQE